MEGPLRAYRVEMEVEGEVSRPPSDWRSTPCPGGWRLVVPKLAAISGDAALRQAIEIARRAGLDNRIDLIVVLAF